MATATSTGKLTNCQKKSWSFFFDCGAPEVNFSNGLYLTNQVIKNKSVITYAAIKYFQDLSTLSGTVRVLGPGSKSINLDNLPITNVVDEFALATFFQPNATTTPPTTFVNPITSIDTNNEFIYVQLSNMPTAGTISALSFEVYLEVTEFDI